MSNVSPYGKYKYRISIFNKFYYKMEYYEGDEINGHVLTEEEYNNLFPNIKFENLKEYFYNHKELELFNKNKLSLKELHPLHLFWHGPFSQWFMSDFVIGENKYCCCEQYMMAKKAELFKDNEIYSKIMKCSDPKTIKNLGRQVQNFVLEDWQNIVKDVLFLGNLCKFTQNKDLLKLIKINCNFVEASPYDAIYGVKMSKDNPLINNRKKWLGTNILGETLDSVRDAVWNKN
jgi:ribA/ribD-fused uncharacterized protein